MSTKKTKQPSQEGLGLPDFLITGSGVESWVRILEEERDLGRGAETGGEKVPVSRWWTELITYYNLGSPGPNS